MKVLKTISMFSLSAVLIGGAVSLAPFEASADRVKVEKSVVAQAVKDKVAATLQTGGMQGAKVDVHVSTKKINFHILPAPTPYTVTTVLKAFDRIREDAVKIGGLFGVSPADIKGDFFINRSSGHASASSNPTTDQLQTQKYGIRYVINLPEGGTDVVEESKWLMIFGPVPGPVLVPVAPVSNK